MFLSMILLMISSFNYRSFYSNPWRQPVCVNETIVIRYVIIAMNIRYLYSIINSSIDLQLFLFSFSKYITVQCTKLMIPVFWDSEKFIITYCSKYTLNKYLHVFVTVLCFGSWRCRWQRFRTSVLSLVVWKILFS